MYAALLNAEGETLCAQDMGLATTAHLPIPLSDFALQTGNDFLGFWLTPQTYCLLYARRICSDTQLVGSFVGVLDFSAIANQLFRHVRISESGSLSLLLLAVLLCGCSSEKAGVAYIQNIIYQNDIKFGNLTRPRVALDLITYRETDIASTASSIIFAHLDETASNLVVPVNICWKNEHVSGHEALAYTQEMLDQQHAFLLLYTPELMLQELQDQTELGLTPIAMLAREPVCFVVNTNSGFGTVRDLQLAAKNGQKLRAAGSTVSGGLDALRFVHLLGLPEDSFTYLPCTEASPIYAVLSGEADVACVPIRQAVSHVDSLRRLTITAPHEYQFQLGSNWLCILAPAQLPSSNPEFWYIPSGNFVIRCSGGAPVPVICGSTPISPRMKSLPFCSSGNFSPHCSEKTC